MEREKSRGTDFNTEHVETAEASSRANPRTTENFLKKVLQHRTGLLLSPSRSETCGWVDENAEAFNRRF